MIKKTDVYYIFIVNGREDKRFIENEVVPLCAMANAREYGEDYIIAPYAKIDDGYTDVVVGRSMLLPLVGIMFSKIKAGTHFESASCRSFIAGTDLYVPGRRKNGVKAFRH